MRLPAGSTTRGSSTSFPSPSDATMSSAPGRSGSSSWRCRTSRTTRSPSSWARFRVGSVSFATTAWIAPGISSPRPAPAPASTTRRRPLPTGAPRRTQQIVCPPPPSSSRNPSTSSARVSLPSLPGILFHPEPPGHLPRAGRGGRDQRVVRLRRDSLPGCAGPPTFGRARQGSLHLSFLYPTLYHLSPNFLH